MTKEQAKEMLPIFKAFAEGKTIQILNEGEWCDLYDTDFKSSIDKYRIKPEPKHRPFNDQEECWNEMHKHPDFGWVKAHNTGHLCQINCFYYGNRIGIDCNDLISFRRAFDDYLFPDGAPFGIKEE